MRNLSSVVETGRPSSSSTRATKDTRAAAVVCFASEIRRLLGRPESVNSARLSTNELNVWPSGRPTPSLRNFSPASARLQRPRTSNRLFKQRVASSDAVVSVPVCIAVMQTR
eukprot:scaffold33027_cov124-Isochrysis_galbana.AAC.2